MTYRCKATVALVVTVDGDAETYVEVSHEDVDASDYEDVYILCSDTVYPQMEVEFEVEADTEEEAKKKVEEMLEDPDKWQATVTIGGVEGLVSVYVDEVEIEELEVEALSETLQGEIADV